MAGGETTIPYKARVVPLPRRQDSDDNELLALACHARASSGSPAAQAHPQPKRRHPREP